MSAWQLRPRLRKCARFYSVGAKLSAGYAVESLMFRNLRVSAALIVLAYSGAGTAADVSAYVVATSDYVHRGISYSDGHAAGQVGVDLNFDNGAYVGLWGSTVDIGGGTTHERDRQVNYYAGYLFEATQQLAVGFSVVAYSFPASAGSFDYSYEEYGISFGFNDRVWLEYNYSPDIYGTGKNTRNFEVSTERDAPYGTMIGAGAGYYDVADLTGAGYGYWHVGISRAFGNFNLDLRFHDTNRSVPFISSPDRAESRVSLSARLQF